MRTALPLALVAAIACLLYLPYLGNPPVFDDIVFYSGVKLAEHASSPLGLGQRHTAYFTLAIVEVLWGAIEAHRVVALALHVACGWALFALIRELAGGTLLPLAGAAWFVAHPVAVYGAGYLMQRSIVMATLFALVSALAYLRGLRRETYLGAVAAGLAYALAVLSKEHAVLVAGVALATSAVAVAQRAFALRYAALYLAACAPAALFVIALGKGLIGASNEPQFEAISAEVSVGAAPGAAGDPRSPWLGSALAQAALFFRYVALWLLPQVSRMSVDLRVDFASLWAPAVAIPAVVGWLAWGGVAAWLLRRGGRAAVAGVGLAWVWVLFLLEFTVIRYQEPFVLYRSYLWAPGLAIAVVAALGRLPRAAVAVLLGVAAAALPAQSYDRLSTFASGLALWEDAVKKLPYDTAPGGSRTLYFLGREYLYADQPRKAVEVVERCVAGYPASAYCRFARAAIHMHFEEYEAAVPHLVRAIALEPKAGASRHHLGWVLENLGCLEEAKAQYRAAERLGWLGAKYRLQRLEKPGSGMLAPPKKEKKKPACPPSIRSAGLPPG